jgi:hypothetical protein
VHLFIQQSTVGGAVYRVGFCGDQPGTKSIYHGGSRFLGTWMNRMK